MDSSDQELVDCPNCLGAYSNRTESIHCYWCSTATAANPGKIPAAMAVELSLTGPKELRDIVRIRKNHGLNYDLTAMTERALRYGLE